MKTLFLALGLLLTGLPPAHAQAKLPGAAGAAFTQEEQELLALSKTKWTWMADKNVDALNGLFKQSCVFVHMGGSWGKDQELGIIKGGMIWYKKAEVYSAAVNTFGNTAILLNDIDLVAMVGGKEAVNPFMVTEVYLKEDGEWKLGSLTFSHLARPLKLTGSANQPPQH
ncbi:nuclear transport factor 2 family protein [Hymenobacter cheonanensis]|uniref:nuclear transport factor 2 family protein n=1 Tax=Hymenobacter sp. CA2-7 TaxID=3063993 RepID=UPI0027134520|nr:nuclear transport factor 2 family protein [Hymenobacter sp. CA2-7]MDO7885705.1 nuclear transport factor 2 family protein [Hymenobacter sp. CA2-7]